MQPFCRPPYGTARCGTKFLHATVVLCSLGAATTYIFVCLLVLLSVQKASAELQFLRVAETAGMHMRSQHTLTNWLESCGGCCTTRKLCTDLSHL